MKMFAHTLFFISLGFFGLIQAALALDGGRITYVVDGDTFVVEGQSVRLLGINTPEKGRDGQPAEPGAIEATKTLKALVSSPAGALKTVNLRYDGNKTDRYDRLLAHAYLKNGLWINKALVDAGVARVYSFPDNRALLNDLLEAEATARQNGIGMWQYPDWQVLNATPPPSKKYIGQFHLVKGTPLNTAKVGDKIYLNYGKDWRTDFTVEIPEKFWPLFKESGIDPATHYTGKALLARGWLKPVNGVLITATHPEQLQILEKN